MFRAKKSIPVEPELQGYIYFASRMYRKLDNKGQRRVRDLCTQAGGEYHKALFEFVTTDAGSVAVCQKHYISQSTLERIVRKYYVAFAKQYGREGDGASGRIHIQD